MDLNSPERSFANFGEFLTSVSESGLYDYDKFRERLVGQTVTNRRGEAGTILAIQANKVTVGFSDEISSDRDISRLYSAEFLLPPSSEILEILADSSLLLTSLSKPHVDPTVQLILEDKDDEVFPGWLRQEIQISDEPGELLKQIVSSDELLNRVLIGSGNDIDTFTDNLLAIDQALTIRNIDLSNVDELIFGIDLANAVIEITKHLESPRPLEDAVMAVEAMSESLYAWVRDSNNFPDQTWLPPDAREDAAIDWILKGRDQKILTAWVSITRGASLIPEPLRGAILKESSELLATSPHAYPLARPTLHLASSFFGTEQLPALAFALIGGLCHPTGGQADLLSSRPITEAFRQLQWLKPEAPQLSRELAELGESLPLPGPNAVEFLRLLFARRIREVVEDRSGNERTGTTPLPLTNVFVRNLERLSEAVFGGLSRYVDHPHAHHLLKVLATLSDEESIQIALHAMDNQMIPTPSTIQLLHGGQTSITGSLAWLSQRSDETRAALLLGGKTVSPSRDPFLERFLLQARPEKSADELRVLELQVETWEQQQGRPLFAEQSHVLPFLITPLPIFRHNPHADQKLQKEVSQVFHHLLDTDQGLLFRRIQKIQARYGLEEELTGGFKKLCELAGEVMTLKSQSMDDKELRTLARCYLTARFQTDLASDPDLFARFKSTLIAPKAHALLEWLNNISSSVPEGTTRFVVNEWRGKLTSALSTYEKDTSKISTTIQFFRNRGLVPYRGYFGRDCTDGLDIAHSANPFTDYIFIADEERILGYIGVLEGEVEGKRALFVDTIQVEGFSRTQCEEIVTHLVNSISVDYDIITAPLKSNMRSSFNHIVPRSVVEDRLREVGDEQIFLQIPTQHEAYLTATGTGLPHGLDPWQGDSLLRARVLWRRISPPLK